VFGNNDIDIVKTVKYVKVRINFYTVHFVLLGSDAHSRRKPQIAKVSECDLNDL
jgi:hypothetical protein